MGSADDDKTHKDEYEDAVTKYSEDKKDMSRVERSKAEHDIQRLKVKKDYDEDTVSLYGMSKSRAYDFLSSDPDGKALSKKLIAYGDALVDAGLATYNKFRDRKGNVSIQPKSKGSGRSRGGSRKTDFSLYGGGSSVNPLSFEKSLRQLLKEARLS